ncbi:MAG: hypothetical protein QXG39_08555 [Candidatus Aenigmatarchaeota archaeon]
MKIEIYFSDLSTEKQEEIIKLIGYDSNWEVFPICVLEFEVRKMNREKVRKKLGGDR